MFHLYNFQFAKEVAPQANIRTTANLIVTIAEIITKTRPCNILHYFTAVKNDDFQMKNCDIFLIFAEYIDFGYTLRTASVRRF